MNREIKFRAFDKKQNKMSELFRIFEPIKFIFHTSTYPPHNNPADFEIMQFTGLKDKNGKEICECDIVFYRNNVARVNYSAPTFSIFPEMRDEVFAVCFDECEVIGNIYENPDLLKKGEN